ncbi:fumarylacetoacetate hydrolase family protein [Dongia soli]|uniref:Fumarylacetoacetate hydrolase family protein n=1 Tax=Dongia soli TaxID=600628 RepID=A0ABU5EDJ2_9PROT|nr:fumarylacetoacetate hydrolase family protein [Dongia soli]MDY0884443.1 fumarylacetoacetate hydrolase family protein [Dongia soli]
MTCDEIADPNNLDLWLSLDRTMFRNGNSWTMVYQVPFLITYLSRFKTLQPGDIISTGAPPGVGMGRETGTCLSAAGQEMRLGLPGLASSAR